MISPLSLDSGGVDWILAAMTSDILYYEVLNIPLPELQNIKTLKVAFHHSTKNEVVSHSIRLSKNSTVGDMMNCLKSKVELCRPDAELRMVEVFYHKIYKIFPPHEKMENINDQYWTLRVEEIPEEETNLGPPDRLIHVYHFMKDPNQNQWKFAVLSMNHPEYLKDSDIVSGCFQKRDPYVWERYLGLEHTDTTPES
ncbi:hypothetical protein LUZ63_005597 [Rhynchospora breviuscula]|uniref:ubiquitinyl hydrolase 1 n=1 Tax=Rhynchospora breviuscula TaxID=2022672 RepID=A0A9Q0CNS0_9POAL|nr:hypothetical protein LUZ63_005597 [Rhynchospora breviuscula]